MAKTDDKKDTGHMGTAQKETPKAQTVKAELLKKITTKLVMDGRISAADVANGAIHLYGVIGICTGAKVGESQYGAWMGFTGQFEATRYKDGARFVAPIAFIPEPASSMMAAALDRAAKNNQEPSLQFAFIIGAKKSTAAIGFEYTVEPVLQASQNDALQALRDQIAPRLLSRD
jgi:hypothetical protein